MNNEVVAANQFHVALEAPQIVPRHVDCPDPAKYSDELDDVRSVLADLCDVLAEEQGIRFVVQGFDDMPWRTTVRTDLAVTLEQIPEVLDALKNTKPVVLDFYEQGLERAVRFEGAGAEVSLTCTSRHLSWSPSPETIRMRREELVRLLRELAEAFLRAATQACPSLVKHRFLTAWAADVQKNS